MANSRFQYVRDFETDDTVLKNCWMVVRIDGTGFHKFTDAHGYEKPNDLRGLGLMNECAAAVMKAFHDIVIAYGESDEYSFVFRRSCTTYSRRASKLISQVVSIFSTNFVFLWPRFFPETTLRYPPSFDSRLVLYPTDGNIRDYLSWRQADCHINNLYNTCFWALVHGGQTPQEAQETLKGTLSDQKNELLFSKFGINYAKLPAMFRRGSVLVSKGAMSRAAKKEKQKEKKVNAKRKLENRESLEGGAAPAAAESAIVDGIEKVENEAAAAVGDENKESQSSKTATTADKDGKTNDAADEKGEKPSSEDAAIVLMDCAVLLHDDVIGEGFWKKYPFLLDP